MAAMLDIVQILYLAILTKRLEIETTLLWGANIMSYINLQIVTLEFDLSVSKNIEEGS